MANTCTITDILQGPVTIYAAVVGTAEPADSVAFGGAWPAGWVALGLTDAPLTMTLTQETNQIQPQQVAMDVKEVVTRQIVELATNLLETSLTNLIYGTNGVVTTTAAGAGQVGKDEIEFGTAFSLAERAWGFEALNSYGLVQRFIVRKATSKSGGAPVWDRDNELFWPLMIHALDPCDGTEPVYGLNVTAEATS